MTTVYLAGPDVFLREAVAIGEAKKELCTRHGFIGLFPLDAELSEERTIDLPTRIFAANMEALIGCDAVIANLTPFRGMSADVGTVFEIAYAFALSKPVFGYSNVAGDLLGRVVSALGMRDETDATKRVFAGDGMVVEDFGLADNLMIVEAIRRQGRNIATRDISRDGCFTDLTAFEDSLRMARHHFGPVDAKVEAA